MRGAGCGAPPAPDPQQPLRTARRRCASAPAAGGWAACAATAGCRRRAKSWDAPAGVGTRVPSAACSCRRARPAAAPAGWWPLPAAATAAAAPGAPALLQKGCQSWLQLDAGSACQAWGGLCKALLPRARPPGSQQGLWARPTARPRQVVHDATALHTRSADRPLHWPDRWRRWRPHHVLLQYSGEASSESPRSRNRHWHRDLQPCAAPGSGCSCGRCPAPSRAFAVRLKASRRASLASSECRAAGPPGVGEGASLAARPGQLCCTKWFSSVGVEHGVAQPAPVSRTGAGRAASAPPPPPDGTASSAPSPSHLSPLPYPDACGAEDLRSAAYPLLAHAGRPSASRAAAACR